MESNGKDYNRQYGLLLILELRLILECMTWYEEEIQELENKRLQSDIKSGMIFYGSSTIRLWDSLEQDFSDYKPINLGFGGSTLEACVWYFDRIVALYNPKSLIIYAGDNDLGDGRLPKEVFIYFMQLIVKIKHHFEGLPFAFISIKPSISRLDIINHIIYTNQLIEEEISKQHTSMHFINVFDQMLDEQHQPLKELYQSDGLHMNKKGYELWKQIIFKDKFITAYRA